MKRLLVSFWLGCLTGMALTVYFRDYDGLGVADSLPQGAKMSRQRKNRTNRTPARKRSAADWGPKFLARLALCGNIREAAQAVKITRSTVYLRRDNDPVFAAGMIAALEDADDRLEATARQLAKRGNTKLLTFLLGVRRYPRKTVEHKHSGSVNVPITHDLTTRLAPYERILQTFLGCGGAVRPDGAVQSVDSPQAPPEAGSVPVI